jgi:CMP-N-acetylneuraminic acid synthetase
MKIVALLPMKGNSERVPNKNLKDFSGKPLYHRVMETLLNSDYIDTVVVNTDSDIIKNDLKKHFEVNVVIVNRPAEIIGDFVSMNKIIECDINAIEADLYLQTHSTNPLLKTESVNQAIEKMIALKENNEFDSVFSVTKLQTRLYKADGVPFNHNPEELLRTQDLEPLYEENSNFYIFTKESFVKSGGKRIGCKPFMFEIDKIEAVDIDEPQDFFIAESLFKLLS